MATPYCTTMSADALKPSMIDPEPLARVEMVIFDFDGVFTDNSVFVDQNGIETVRCWRSDGLGLSRLRSVGVQTYIVSTEANPVVAARAAKLKIDHVQAVADKAAAVLEICERAGISPGRTMFVGNDINDIPALDIVGLPVAVADAHPAVYPHVRQLTECNGGHGAVREICDLIYDARTNKAVKND